MKKYSYKGKIYCNEDLSEQIENYEGDLFDLYLELKEDDKVEEATLYYASYNSGEAYENTDELIETEFNELEVNEAESAKFFIPRKEPKFKVGDKVKVISLDDTDILISKLKLGDIGEIVKYELTKTYRVQFNSYNNLLLFEEQLELVEEQ